MRPFSARSRTPAAPEGSQPGRALHRHQGYRHDALLKDAKSRWVAGEITSEEMRAEMQAARGKR
jgi:Antitoxin VbhA